MNSMMAFDPTHRPTIAEILSSEWVMSDDVPTHAEVLAEFNKRTMAIAPERMLQDISDEKRNAANLENTLAENTRSGDARSRD